MKVELNDIKILDPFDGDGVAYTATLVLDGKVVGVVSAVIGKDLKNDEHAYLFDDQVLQERFFLFTGGKPDDTVDKLVIDYCRTHNENGTMPD